MAVDKVKQGKKNRASGAAWERKVRKDLEKKGWIVDKWSNNVEFEAGGFGDEYIYNVMTDTKTVGKLIPAKRKFNPFKKVFSIGTGFPDFIAFTKLDESDGFGLDLTLNIKPETYTKDNWLVVGVEAKINGYLDRAEREKCEWLLDNNVFSEVFIASKGIKRGEIVYKTYEKQT